MSNRFREQSLPRLRGNTAGKPFKHASQGLSTPDFGDATGDRLS
jgi:hypothetical protein